MVSKPVVCLNDEAAEVDDNCLDDARKGARKGKGNIVMVGKKGNKVRLEIVQHLFSLRL